MALFATRWPEWNPSDQERRDWRSMAHGWSGTRLEEAMLQVRMKYSSKIPQMKWIRDAYFQLRDAERKANDMQSDRPQTRPTGDQDPQVQSDRQTCMNRLESLAPQEVHQAIQVAERRLGSFLGGFATRDIHQMSWLSRFAILYVIDEGYLPSPS